MDKLLSQVTLAHQRGLIKVSGNLAAEQFARTYENPEDGVPSYATQDGWLPWLREKTDFFSYYTPEQKAMIAAGNARRKANFGYDMVKSNPFISSKYREEVLPGLRNAGNFTAQKQDNIQNKLVERRQGDAVKYWQRILDDQSMPFEERLQAKAKLQADNIRAFQKFHMRAPTQRELMEMRVEPSYMKAKPAPAVAAPQALAPKPAATAATPTPAPQALAPKPAAPVQPIRTAPPIAAKPAPAAAPVPAKPAAPAIPARPAMPPRPLQPAKPFVARTTPIERR